MAIATDLLHERALAHLAEADVWGVAAVEATRGTPLYRSALALLPGARSIVVAGMEIFAEVVGLVQPEKQVGEAAARDLYEPHLDYLNGRLNRAIYEVAKTLRSAGYRALPMPSTGTPSDLRFLRAIFSFKHAAEYAGVGRIGRSSLLLTPKFGPRLRLACLLTNAELPASLPLAGNPCDGCADICIDQCPAKALAEPDGTQPYAIDKFACYAFRTNSGACTTCMAVCPGGAW